MKWWLKALIGSGILVVVLCAVITVIPDGSLTEAQDERFSSLCGSVFGAALVFVWVWCFLKRGASAPQVQEATLDADETVVLDARHCGYLKSNVALIMGKGLITEKRFFWKAGSDLAGMLASAMHRVKSLSIPLSDIQEAEQTSFGANKQVLLIKTTDDRNFRFVVDDVNPWLEVLKSDR